VSLKKLQFIESGSSAGIFFVIVSQKKIPVAQEYNKIKASLIEHITFISRTAFPIGPIKEN